MTTRQLLLPTLLLFGAACAKDASTPPPETAVMMPAVINHFAFDSTADGRGVDGFTMVNSQGMKVTAMSYGAIIQSIEVPDANGVMADVVLGYDSVAGYITNSPYFGATVGRYSNRIAKGKFTLGGRTYTLAVNNGPNALHGGLKGFDRVVWAWKQQRTDSSNGVIFSYTSPDGEEGYPGSVTAQVSYMLMNARNELVIEYEVTADRATPVNLTNHSYFNLAGTGDILGHELTINADSMTPVDTTLIPTGAIVPVAGTPFDFRSPTAIGARIAADDQQLRFGGGYDHNYVLNRNRAGLVQAAYVVEPTSGRTLTVSTTEPGMQFYSGNFLDGSIVGKSGARYAHRHGFCLETQHYPDSPNQAGFPSTIVRPGTAYTSKTVLAFGVK